MSVAGEFKFPSSHLRASSSISSYKIIPMAVTLDSGNSAPLHQTKTHNFLRSPILPLSPTTTSPHAHLHISLIVAQYSLPFSMYISQCSSSLAHIALGYTLSPLEIGRLRHKSITHSMRPSYIVAAFNIQKRRYPHQKYTNYRHHCHPCSLDTLVQPNGQSIQLIHSKK